MKIRILIMFFLTSFLGSIFGQDIAYLDTKNYGLNAVENLDDNLESTISTTTTPECIVGLMPTLMDDISDVNNGAKLKLYIKGSSTGLRTWYTAIKYSSLRTNVVALRKIDNIITSGRVSTSKLKAAIDGDLGDILKAANATDLANILDRLNLSHADAAHFDEIIRRLMLIPH
jgi:hypothetical protein